MIECPDCLAYYRTDRPRIIAGRPDPGDHEWVSRWLGRYHDAGHVDPTTVDIDLVRTAAALVYFPAGVDVFMTGRNAALNHERPLDLIEAGRTRRSPRAARTARHRSDGMIGYIAAWVGGILLAIGWLAGVIRLFIEGLEDRPLCLAAAAVLAAVGIGTVVGAATYATDPWRDRDRCGYEVTVEVPR